MHSMGRMHSLRCVHSARLFSSGKPLRVKRFRHRVAEDAYLTQLRQGLKHASLCLQHAPIFQAPLRSAAVTSDDFVTPMRVPH